VKYVFGPVHSRRLGQSLGIDTIPLKTCNWNCVYCQLGRTRPMTNERREYIPRQDILDELQHAFEVEDSGLVDWVTFVGSGEPTLHIGMGWLLRRVKELTTHPVAVITNGALLYLPEVREELACADAVLPSLDAGNPKLYRKINRPWPKLTFDRILDGLVSFRREYSGQLWLEIMLIRGLNDTPESLKEIAAAYEMIQPDLVHLMLPVRPPAESWVQSSDAYGLQRARDLLGAVVPVVIPDRIPKSATPERTSHADLEQEILGIITRHPMQEDEICAELCNWSSEEVHRVLESLLEQGKVQIIKRFERYFWSSAGSYYGPK
jgi:wyosine [tRNA(Phe)-imidazoG37] synthetase (radical SAM superfamily)